MQVMELLAVGHQLATAVQNAANLVASPNCPIHQLKLTEPIGALEHAVLVGIMANIVVTSDEVAGPQPSLVAPQPVSLLTSLFVGSPSIEVPAGIPYSRDQMWLAWTSASRAERQKVYKRMVEIIDPPSRMGFVDISGDESALAAAEQFLGNLGGDRRGDAN